MRVLIPVLLMSTLVLSGCGGWSVSRANPKNWFGRSTSEVIVATDPGAGQDVEYNPLIENTERSALIRKNKTTIQKSGLLRRRDKVVAYEGTLVDQITDLNVEPTPTGAIVRVTGLPSREGAFDVRLLRENEDGPVDGVMTYTLNAYQPIQTRRGSERTRTVRAGDFLSNDELARTTTIRVQGARNVRTTQR